MLEIDKNKFQFRSCVTEKLIDGSVRIIKYTEPPKTQGELLTLEKPYYSGATSYTLRVTLPQQPKPDIVIVVSHTSTNSWRLMGSTCSGALYAVCNTLAEVNKLLAVWLK